MLRANLTRACPRDLLCFRILCCARRSFGETTGIISRAWRVANWSVNFISRSRNAVRRVGNLRLGEADCVSAGRRPQGGGYSAFWTTLERGEKQVEGAKGAT